MRKTFALAATLIILILACGPSSVPAQVTDSRLIGEWAGGWKVEQAPGVSVIPGRGTQSSGSYQLTITKVEAGKAYGRVHQAGLTVPEFNFVGTLNGNDLSFGNDRFQTSLTIDGDRMKGTRLGGQLPWHISVQKKK